MDVGDWLLSVLQQQGLAVFLVVVGVVGAWWVGNFYMHTIYPDVSRRADERLQLESATADALQALATASYALADVVRQLHDARFNPPPA